MKKESSVEGEVKKSSITASSVYADLGYADHEEMATKANLIAEISEAIKKRKLTQTQVAEIIGISQPKLSELLSGRFRGYSVERLIHFLNALGQDVDIVVSAKPRNRPARVSVYHFNRTSINTRREVAV